VQSAVSAVARSRSTFVHAQLVVVVTTTFPLLLVSTRQSATHSHPYTIIIIITRNSAIADKPRDAFRGHSRSSNMVPFDMLGMYSS